jgi:enoyl-CoA hydratase/carnithine racemase
VFSAEVALACGLVDALVPDEAALEELLVRLEGPAGRTLLGLRDAAGLLEGLSPALAIQLEERMDELNSTPAT